MCVNSAQARFCEGGAYNPVKKGAPLLYNSFIENLPREGDRPSWQMLADALWKENGELQQHLAPVLHAARPFESDIHSDEV
ncbi:glycosyltransferase [Paenibacillus popilliae ATCC 14706]|uniref:Glycosyltransferase n=1 Tax=Paenibacillus popilliae ATCC 14706 TaxID=1212764 RepID=M9LCS1_PAEPP|nr:glycosyltransferase [Paenibacillus popilliae ATCC 14706]